MNFRNLRQPPFPFLENVDYVEHNGEEIIKMKYQIARKDEYDPAGSEDVFRPP